MKCRIQKRMYSSSSYHVKEMIFVSAFKKTVIKLSIYVTIATAILFIAIVPHFFYTKKQIPQHRHLRYPTDLRYILFWEEPTKQKRLLKNDIKFSKGQNLFIEQKCPYINCYITYDKNALKGDHDFDAIVFDVQEVKRMDLEEFNMTRCNDQLYIFRSMESSEKNSICDSNFDNFFNLTWTYRLDSDLSHPFFNIYNANDTVVGPKRNMKWIAKMDAAGKYSYKLKSKNKAVAWVVSKCKLKSRNQDFIKKLRNELRGYNYSLDLYGPCGQKRCPGGNIYKCYKILEKSYYFQLVLEDSFAEDYVTEKVVSAMTHLTIPIVNGIANLKNFLPPGSYINAQTFNIKKLGALIDYLIKNKEMYEHFFDWKKYYYYTARSRNSVCSLCAKLNENITKKTYKDFRNWWNPDFKDVCQRMSLVRMFDGQD